MVLLKKIETPQNIYILGDWVEDLDEEFRIDDDESSFQLRYNGKLKHINTCGVCCIVTQKELFDDKEFFYEDGVIKNEFSFDNIIIKNFCGEIILKLEVATEKDGIIDMINDDNFEYDDYLLHHKFLHKNEYEDIEVVVELVTNADIQVNDVEINDALFTIIGRDVKIDEILE